MQVCLLMSAVKVVQLAQRICFVVSQKSVKEQPEVGYPSRLSSSRTHEAASFCCAGDSPAEHLMTNPRPGCLQDFCDLDVTDRTGKTTVHQKPCVYTQHHVIYTVYSVCQL